MGGNPIMMVLSSGHNLSIITVPPKAPEPNTIISGTGDSTYKL
jgi:hypothetical protein